MKIMAIGAHPDDVALFCAGTLLRALEEKNQVIKVVCTDGEARGKNRVKEEVNADSLMGIKYVEYLKLKDGSLEHGVSLVSKFDKLFEVYDPDVVLSHSDHDHHQDHKAVYLSVKSANRNWKFNWLTYESYDIRSGFNPNVFVDVTRYYKKKLEILKVYESQRDRWYFQPNVIEARSLGANVGKYVERFKVEYLAI